MYHINWKKEILTVPNFLSVFRLILIPVYISIYQNAAEQSDYYLAGTILCISCLTDLADGKIARDFDMVSVVGKLLDPLADKITQFVLIVTLAGKYPVLYYILPLFIVKEVFQCITMVIYAKTGKALPGALPAGKICTTVLFTNLVILVALPELPDTTVFYSVLLDSFFLIYAFYEYTLAYFGTSPKITDLNND